MYDFKPFFLRILFFQPSGAPSPSSHERSKFLVVVASSLKTFFSLFFLYRVASSFFASRAFLWLTLAPSTSFFEVFGGGMVMFSVAHSRYPPFQATPTENKKNHGNAVRKLISRLRTGRRQQPAAPPNLAKCLFETRRVQTYENRFRVPWLHIPSYDEVVEIAFKAMLAPSVEGTRRKKITEMLS